MKSLSQEQRIVGQLIKNGEISRNHCLQNYISRLSAIIFDLREKGWDFKTEERGGDFIYIVTRKPELKLFK